MATLKRAITPLILESLQDTPAVFLNGPRQAGKSTLVAEIARERIHAEYITLDDISTLSAASEDPESFLRHFNKPVVIDEVQMQPMLFRIIKKIIDEIRLADKLHANGKFLLTGSANILALPQLSDALVGRMEVLTLYPLSYGESIQYREGFIKVLFNKAVKFEKLTFERFNLDKVINKATFPELVCNPDTNKEKWFDSYITTLLQRDVRMLAEIEKITVLPNMLKLIASRAGSLLNDASMARDLGLNAVTYRRYRALLNGLFLILAIPPWFRNIGKRFVKAPKIYLTDTALLCHLLGVSSEDLKINNSILFGRVLENLVATELTKQLSLMTDGVLYHFRTQDNKEIDFIIEKRNGEIIAIEVKSHKTIRSKDFDAFAMLKEKVGKDFVKGVVLYPGEEILPFGEKLFAMPLSVLWQLGAERL